MGATLIELEQAEETRLMAMIERLQRAGADERQITAAIGSAVRQPRTRRLARPWRGKARPRVLVTT